MSINVSIYPTQGQNVQVAATPRGPATPTGGWTCVMAEGFYPFYSLGQTTSIFASNRNNNSGAGVGGKDVGGFNVEEVAVFNSSQVLLQSDGVHLRCHYDAGHVSPSGSALTGQSVVNYVSGCLSSQPLLPSGGQTGFDIRGFAYLPTAPAILCLEIVCALPTGTVPGGDFGFWGSSPAGQNELDHLEWTNYCYGHPGWYGASFAQIDHTLNVSSGNEAFSNSQTLLAAQVDGLVHKWTMLIDGSNRTFKGYVDGTHIPEYDLPWLSSFPSNPMPLLLSHAVRDVSQLGGGWAGQAPTFTADKDVIVRSVAAYMDTPHVGVGVSGGGIAAGTTVV